MILPRCTEIIKSCGFYKGMEYIPEEYRDFGTKAHLMASLWIKGTLDQKSLDNGLADSLEALKGFYMANVKEVLYNSIRITSRKHNYTGEPDLVYISHSGKFCIADFKFSKTISPEYPIQLAGYEILVKEAYGYKKLHRQGIMFTENKYKVVPFKDKKDIKRFIACKMIYDYKREKRLIKDETTEYSSSSH